jgi:hypothetical protein
MKLDDDSVSPAVDAGAARIFVIEARKYGVPDRTLTDVLDLGIAQT